MRNEIHKYNFVSGFGVEKSSKEEIVNMWCKRKQHLRLWGLLSFKFSGWGQSSKLNCDSFLSLLRWSVGRGNIESFANDCGGVSKDLEAGASYEGL